MYNASGILKTKYYTSIKAALPSVAVFKNYVPNQLTADNYVLISNVQQVDYSNINKHDVKAFITIGIYTRTVPENDGIGMEDIADAIFGLYPTPQSYPQITGYQVCSLQLESDNELTVSLDSGNTYINRSITFSHILNKLN
jgi:hypothetical protein